MTLLSICQDAADEAGLFRPSTIVGSTDDTARRLLAYAKREVSELARCHEWTILTLPHTITTVASDAEYDLPSDYDRMISDTVWDVSDNEPIRGPLTAQEWQSIKNSFLGSGVVNRRYRLRRATGGVTKQFYVDPTPSTAGESLLFEYISNKPILDTDGSTTKTAWAVDTDTCLLPEYVVTMGVVWRMLRRLGVDYATELAEYERARDREIARDTTASALSLVPSRSINRLLDASRVPDTGFGS